MLVHQSMNVTNCQWTITINVQCCCGCCLIISLFEMALRAPLYGRRTFKQRTSILRTVLFHLGNCSRKRSTEARGL
jgi:hypothetical protein